MSINRFAWLLTFFLTVSLSTKAMSSTEGSTVQTAHATVGLVEPTKYPFEFGKRKKRPPVVTPEPASLLLLAMGMTGLAAVVRQKNKKIVS